jgi:hypothetical protein
MTVPVFTPTPVITPANAADMPASVGSQIGLTTDANFVKTDDWSYSLEQEQRIVTYSPASVFITATANHVIGASTYYLIRGNVIGLRVSLNRTAGAALVSTATGVIAGVQVATLASGFRPPTVPVFFWGRCATDVLFNMYINSVGQVMIRGASAISRTFPATWTLEFDVRWVR